MARVVFVFYEFTDCNLTFTMLSRLVPPITVRREDGKPLAKRDIFDPVMKQCDDNQDLDKTIAIFKVEVFDPFSDDGQKPSKIELSGKVRRVSQPVPLNTVLPIRGPL